MPTLSVRIIKKSRRVRYCEECGRRIEGENVIRLYGMAETYDKPYQIFLHRKCLNSKKEIAMLEAAEHRVHPTSGDSPASEILPTGELAPSNQVISVPPTCG